MTVADTELACLDHIRFRGVPVSRMQASLARVVNPRLPHKPAIPVEEPYRVEPEPDEFVQWVLTRVGLHATRYRAGPFMRRLPACLRAIRAQSVEQARELLERNPRLVEAAVNSLLLGVTEFFRDKPVFDHLARELPRLRADGQPMRIWSAGCSDGAELYSVAILLAESGLLDGCDLLGSDCRGEAVRLAEAGVYAPVGLGGLEPDLRARYFVDLGKWFRIVDDIRGQTRWKLGDILEEMEPGPWNVILWRNSAIYLQPAWAKQVWGRLVDQLAPGGLLVTGRAERPGREHRLTRLSGCIYRKEEEGTHGR